jgi:hypothetical protein
VFEESPVTLYVVRFPTSLGYPESKGLNELEVETSKIYEVAPDTEPQFADKLVHDIFVAPDAEGAEGALQQPRFVHQPVFVGAFPLKLFLD